MYERFFDQSVEEFGAVIGTDNPDLTAFRDRGGKQIVWHGWADQLISAQGTVDYYKRVVASYGRSGQRLRSSSDCSWRPVSGIAAVAPVLAHGPDGSAGCLGRRRESSGNVAGIAPRSRYSADTSAMPVPAGRQIQGNRQHGRCGELCVQRGILIPSLLRRAVAKLERRIHDI